MMQSRTSHAESPAVRVVLITLDRHVAAAVERARVILRRELPNLELDLHVAADWAGDRGALSRCRADIAAADVIIATMLFVEDHINAVKDAIEARRDAADAVVCCVSAAEIVKLTKLGRFSMSAEASGPMALLKKLKDRFKPSAPTAGKGGGKSQGASQMAMLRQIPKILRFIPGTAQDVRAYFLAMQYWLSGSDENLAGLVCFLVDRYASGPRASLKGRVGARPPAVYPDVGLYHPRLKGRITERLHDLPEPAVPAIGTVGLILMRSYVLSGDTGHYDGVIAEFERRGLKVVPAFASGLDAREAINHFFLAKTATGETAATVDAVVSLTGFSLVGGPAYNDADAAEEILAKLDVPYLAAHAIEFQSLEQWRHSDRGLMPIEQTIMVAIPEIDGATAPTVFGGRSSCADRCGGCERACQVDRADGIHRMQACIERAEVLAARTARLVELRTTARAERKIGVVLFNFPPNAGATGTAAYLGVFESLFNVMHRLAREGYTVELPQSVDALRRAILEGNSEVFGADANVHIRLSADDHVRRERYLTDIERQWGPAPGRQQSDGQNILVLGKQFGNLLVAVQPGFGYEGDPMRLLFEGGFAPTHAFSAFYRYLREDFRAHALLHFGTHGALEFMPGKQSGSTSACWPERLIGDVPNVYLYAANNPSEGTIAKRRSAATLVSYLTPAVAQAGLYRGLLDLKSTLDRLRAQDPAHADERSQMLLLISEQARAVDLIGDDVDLTALDPAACDAAVALLGKQILELEYELIPHGLHVIGESMSRDVVSDLIQSIAEAGQGLSLSRAVVSDLLDGADRQKLAQRLGRDAGSADVTAIRSNLDTLADVAQKLKGDGELDGLVRALDARFIRPVAGGDILKSVDVLPTGRNVHGFDPFRMPTAFAVRDGRDQANRLISRHVAEGHGLPETVAIVLWGTDNLKSEGGPIAQALALLGAEPRFDSYGRLTGAKLIPLNELGRPRIDVVITLSGIFRDLLPLQTRMLAEAAYLAATADEPVSHNLVRAHALAYADRMGCDIEVAALRVFSNADGTYGANVNQLVDAGCWSDEDELADAYETRKSFAYGRDGKPVAQKDLLASVLATVDVAYQNLESVELGVTTIDHYFDTLGGIGRAVRRARGGRQASIYIGDQTRTGGKVRTLAEQVALETRTRMLNPKWTEGMLKHGYEGVRQIEAHVTNTIGWSATTGAVAPWVYQQISETYVLDEAMRRRLSQLNPKASAKVARRLLEAHERNYWNPDEQTLEALREAGDELDDRVEGLGLEEAAA